MAEAAAGGPLPWSGRRIHLVGIGGAGMSGWARVAVQLGATVSGSDRVESPALNRLRALGVTVHVGHSAANVPDLKKVSLGSSVKFADVWVQHQPERYTTGKAFLYFWPSGLTESAGIRLAQGDDVYTIVVAPLTGRAKVVNGRVDAPGEK